MDPYGSCQIRSNVDNFFRGYEKISEIDSPKNGEPGQISSFPTPDRPFGASDGHFQ